MDESQRGMRSRMLAGELYIADDPELARDSARAQRLTHQISTIDPTDHQRRRALLAELLGGSGEGSDIRPPLQCDHGYQTFVGARCFTNWGLISLDVAAVTIGADTVVGAGAVVAGDLPAAVVAVGSPARVVRAL
jgi:maltose O-acetyltransferase